MHRLAGADASFIYEERSWRPLHTLKVLVFAPRADGSALSATDVVGAIERRLHHLDPLRWELRKVPGRFHLPVFVDTGAVDVAAHVRTVTAPSPGDDRALATVASGVASELLPRDRPLWEVVVVEGLAGGQVAVVWKIHHAIADGLASLRLIEELCDLAPAGDVARDGPRPSRGEPLVAGSRLARDAVADLGRLARGVPALTGRLVRATAASTRRKRAGGPQPALAFSAPATAFNQDLTPQRSFVFVDVPMADVRRVKDALGGTINDVVLAICSAVVRGYLADRGELPAVPMSAVVPVSIRHEGATTPWGNFPSNFYVSLATDIDDPRARYRAISESQAAAKSWHDTREHWIQYDWMTLWPLWSLYTRALPYAVSKLAKRATYGLVASNVRGPAQPLYLAGAPMIALHSMGPLVRDLALNITAWSYLDRMSFGFHTCAGHLPDPWELAERVPTALAELLALG